MKTTFSVTLPLLIALVLLIASCGDDQKISQNYSTHVAGWMDSTSANFHGQAVVQDPLLYNSCRDCHAVDHTDREILFCHACHAAYPHSIAGDSAEVVSQHLPVVRSFNWRLEQCSKCHGSDFAGGRTRVSCLGCHHTQENPPSSCTTCHGLPPVDDTTLPFGMAENAAGGHVAMVVEKGYACTVCHAPVADLSHTGPLPAVVTFSDSSIARARGDASAPYPATYQHLGDPNSGNASCAVYCHSNARGGAPNDPVPQWTTEFEFTCNSCHFSPPSAPHPQVTTCHNCHSNVDPSSQYPNDIRFINEQLHVDGIVEL